MPTAAQILSGGEPPEQDWVQFATMRTPGRATVTAGAFRRKLQIAEPLGVAGGSVYNWGEGLKTAEVRVDLWTDQHWADWEVFSKAILFKDPGQFALTVSHPVLDKINFHACIVEEVSIFEQDDYGMWSCTIKLQEWRPKKPQASKPKAAIPEAAKPTPTAVDVADEQTLQLIGQVKTLAAFKG